MLKNNISVPNNFNHRYVSFMYKWWYETTYLLPIHDPGFTRCTASTHLYSTNLGRSTLPSRTMPPWPFLFSFLLVLTSSFCAGIWKRNKRQYISTKSHVHISLSLQWTDNCQTPSTSSQYMARPHGSPPDSQHPPPTVWLTHRLQVAVYHPARIIACNME